MIKKVFLTILPIIIILSMFAYCFSIEWNILQIPFMNEINYNGITLYEYDILAYAKNIDAGFKSPELLELYFPTRTWVEIEGLDWFADLANNLAVLFNWCYMPINILIYPIRILTYIIRNMFALMGLPIDTIIYKETTYEPMWFMEVLKNLTKNLSIPYI